MFLNLILLVFSTFYGLFIGLMINYWAKAKIFVAPQKPKNIAYRSISVLIPVRNEANTIGLLLDDLSKQKMPREAFEIIVVDDHSTDQTASLVKEFAENHLLNVKLISLNLILYGSPKKSAISLAIQQANGELIVCTDGDCRVGEHWLSTLYDCYLATGAKFISAPVTFDAPRNLFEKMQVVEFASLIGTGAAAMFAKKPNMCNGANIAYPKSVFEEINGYVDTPKLSSGDDEFLMQKIYKRYPDKVQFLKSQYAIVSTRPQSTLGGFWQQRKRWASKWNAHKNTTVRATALFVFFFHLLSILSILSLIFDLYIFDNHVIITHLGLKIIPEWIFLTQILNFLKHKKYSIYILPVQLIYSFYVVLTAIFANIGSYEWKGRKN